MDIDEICDNKYGHTNWIALKNLSDQQKVGIDEVAEIETINGEQIAFFYEEDE